MVKRDNRSGWKRWGKIAGVALLIVTGLFLVVQILFALYAEPYLKNRIKSALSGNSGKMKTEIGNLSLSLLQRQLQVENLKTFRNDSLSSPSDTSYSPIDSLSVQEISISGIGLLPWLFYNELVIGSVTITQPYLSGVKPPNQKSSRSRSGGGKSLYASIQPRLNALEIKEFHINSLSGSLRDSLTAEQQTASLFNLDLRLGGVRIDSASARKNRFLPVKRIQGGLDSLVWHPSSGFYDFKVNGVEWSSEDSAFSTKNISLIPQLPKYEFSQKMGHEIDRIDLSIGELELKGLNFDSLFAQKALTASAFYIRDTQIEIFHDKKMPSGEVKTQTYPHVQFRQMTFPVRIDSMVLSNADIRYGEHNNMVPEPGFISFENTNAVVRNVTNRISSDSAEGTGGNSPKTVKNDSAAGTLSTAAAGSKNNSTASEPMTMHASSYVQGEGLLKANFTFPFNNTGAHHVSGSLGPMPMEALNPPLKYLGYVQINSGQIHSMDFDIQLGEQESTGSLYMHYTDMSMQLIDFENMTDVEQDQLKTFIANTFVIKENNTPPLREGTVSFERVEDKSIFNYWWKSLLSGLKSSVGL